MDNAGGSAKLGLMSVQEQKPLELPYTPLGPGFGAAVEGIDLSAEVPSELANALYRLFLERHVLAIRGQSLTPERVLAASRLFGADLEPHVLSQYHHAETPLILVLTNRSAGGKPLGVRDGGSFWHSDNSYKPQPAKATLLYALEVPEAEGDTLFCDMTQAYAELPAGLKAKVEGRTATHDYGFRDDLAVKEGRIPVLTPEQRRATPAVHHPIVRTHPETGAKALYISPGVTRSIDGLDETESEALKAEIFAHCLDERFGLRYRWRAGDVVVWDNAAVMHSATTKDLAPEKSRTLWRTIISGGPTF